MKKEQQRSAIPRITIGDSSKKKGKIQKLPYIAKNIVRKRKLNNKKLPQPEIILEI